MRPTINQKLPIIQTDIYAASGYDADIESYIYSSEYESAFGNYTVPYYRGFSSIPGMKTVGYNRIFALHRGFSNSDNAQYGRKNSRLRCSLFTDYFP